MLADEKYERIMAENVRSFRLKAKISDAGFQLGQLELMVCFRSKSNTPNPVHRDDFHT
jgi:hypothetical protein